MFFISHNFSFCCSSLQCVFEEYWRIQLQWQQQKVENIHSRCGALYKYTHMIELSHSLWICCSFSFAWHSICIEPNEIYKPENILIFVEWDSQQPSGWLWWKNKIENKNKKKVYNKSQSIHILETCDYIYDETGLNYEFVEHWL